MVFRILTTHPREVLIEAADYNTAMTFVLQTYPGEQVTGCELVASAPSATNATDATEDDE